FAAALEDLWHVALQDAVDPLGIEVHVARAERRVHQAGPDLVVLLRDPHEATDHARDDRLGDLRDEVARFPALDPVQDTYCDLLDGLLVVGYPPRREARLEECLQPVVLWRV